MKNFEFVELNAQELEEVNGGHCPTSWYTNDSTIKANGEAISFAAGAFVGIFEGAYDKFKSFLGL